MENENIYGVPENDEAQSVAGFPVEPVIKPTVYNDIPKDIENKVYTSSYKFDYNSPFEFGTANEVLHKNDIQYYIERTKYRKDFLKDVYKNAKFDIMSDYIEKYGVNKIYDLTVNKLKENALKNGKNAFFEGRANATEYMKAIDNNGIYGFQYGDIGIIGTHGFEQNGNAYNALNIKGKKYTTEQLANILQNSGMIPGDVKSLYIMACDGGLLPDSFITNEYGKKIPIRSFTDSAMPVYSTEWYADEAGINNFLSEENAKRGPYSKLHEADVLQYKSLDKYGYGIEMHLDIGKGGGDYNPYFLKDMNKQKARELATGEKVPIKKLFDTEQFEKVSFEKQAKGELKPPSGIKKVDAEAIKKVYKSIESTTQEINGANRAVQSLGKQVAKVISKFSKTGKYL